MIRYVVNFNEIENSLKDLLSGFFQKEESLESEFFNKEFTFPIPPLRGNYNFTFPINNVVSEIFFTVDGFTPEDSLVVNAELEHIIKFCYSNRIISFKPTFLKDISIAYNSEGGYKNVKMYVKIIKEE